MSFKHNCQYIFIREFVNLSNEYRCIVIGSELVYIERYIGEYKINMEEFYKVKTLSLIVRDVLKYDDVIFDIGILDNGEAILIEVNTPPYLFGGIHLMDEEEYDSCIYNSTSLILRWQEFNMIREHIF